MRRPVSAKRCWEYLSRRDYMKVARYEVPGSHEKQVPSRRDGMIRATGRSSSLGGKYIESLGSPRPYGTGPPFGHIPGNKLPGYLHLVPPGQRLSSPFGTTNRLSPPWAMVFNRVAAVTPLADRKNPVVLLPGEAICIHRAVVLPSGGALLHLAPPDGSAYRSSSRTRLRQNVVPRTGRGQVEP